MATTHANQHPQYVEDCFRCKLESVSIAPSATPSRTGGARAAQINATDRRWDKDMAAYKRLRRDGIQPKGIDGSANYEAKASTKWEIETGNFLPESKYGKGIERRVKEGLDMAEEMKG